MKSKLLKFWIYDIDRDGIHEEIDCLTDGLGDNSRELRVHGYVRVILHHLANGLELLLQVVTPHFPNAALLVGHGCGGGVGRASHHLHQPGVRRLTQSDLFLRRTLPMNESLRDIVRGPQALAPTE